MAGEKKSGALGWFGVIMFLAAVLAFGYMVYFGK